MGLLIRQLFDFISRSSVQLLSLEAMELRRMLNDTDAVIRDQSYHIVRHNCSSDSEQDTLNTRAIRKGIAFY